MRISHWLTRLQNHRPTRKSSRRVPQQTTESLERRTLLTTVGILTGPTELTIFVEDGDAATVQRNQTTGNVEVLDGNGQPYTSIPSIQASQLTSLNIFADDSDNVLSVAPINVSEFSMLSSIVIEAGNGNDLITGSNDFAEMIDGGDGADTIVGAGGNDTLDGGDGDDSISGNAGQDVIIGDDGQDTIDGGTGNDNIDAGDGQDSVDGGDGDDTINAGDGLDTVNGGAGADSINGMSGADLLNGDADNDTILGGSENDTVNGGDGNDIVNGQAGNDTVNGDAGDDTGYGGGGRDVLFGGDGNDIVNGQSGDDTIFGGNGSDRGYGGSGDDAITGGEGDDTLNGHSGNDSLFGTAGADLLNGGSGNDLLQSIGATFTISPPGTITEGDSGTQVATFTVTLGEPSIRVVSVQFRTVDGEAIAGSDYTATSGQLVFLSGETTKTINVSVTGDTAGEGLETFSVELFSPQGSIVLDSTATATIADDDVQISIADATTMEGNSGTSPLAFTVSLSTPSTGTVNVDFATANGDAVGGLDYVAQSGTLTFAPGTTTQTVTVSIFGDTVGENSETFFVNLSNPVNGAIVDGQGQGTIQDDDGGPLQFSDDDLSSVVYDYGAHDHDHDHDSGGSSGETGLGFTFNDGARWTNTATDGGGLGQGDATTLTWGIVADGTTTQAGCGAPAGQTSDLIAFLDGVYNETATGPDLTTRTWFVLFQSVFDEFTSFSGITFVYEPNDDGVPISGANSGVLGVRPDIRIVGHMIPAPVIGCNFFPNHGDMALETSRGFFTNTANNSVRLRNSIGHELGHGIGLNHVIPVNQTKLMEPTISAAFDGPQEDDILAVNRGYGDRNESGTGNDTTATATSLGNLVPNASLGTTQVSIDDDSDTDVFAFTLTGSADVSIDVDPTGTIYQSGPQNGTPTTFNAEAQNDLAFEVLADDGVTILASVSATGLGQTESLLNLNLAAGDYFLRVTGTENSVQMYDISMSAVAATPPLPMLDNLSDTLDGGSGNDTLIASLGDDFVFGGTGQDSLFGGSGNDSIEGGDGNDTIDGGSGDDTIAGQGGDDVISTGSDIDTVLWNGLGNGTDTILESDGAQTLIVQGDSGVNSFNVDSNLGRLRVSEGAASITASRSTTTVNVNGGSGDDIITITSIADVNPLVLNIDGQADDDTITALDANIGDVRMFLNGGAGNDTITGSRNNDSINGNGGDDSVIGGLGNDSVDGGDGNDTLNGEAGNDTLLGNLGNDLALGGDGADSLSGGFGNDTLVGEAGNDVLSGGFGNDVLNGNSGDDLLAGGQDNDQLLGGSGDDSLNGGSGDDTLRGQSDNDLIKGGDGNDLILGDDGNDVISGGDGDDDIDAGNGDDIVTGADGNDTINGMSGDDTLLGGDGNDNQLGGSGVDSLYGEEGDDSLNGGGSIDQFNGGEGADVLVSPDAGEVDNNNLLIQVSVLEALALLNGF